MNYINIFIKFLSSVSVQLFPNVQVSDTTGDAR